MWVLFSTENGGGFMSIVAKNIIHQPTGPEPTATMTVRFRREEDAGKVFPGFRVQRTPYSDYPFRVYAERQVVAKVLEKLANDINYDNFKASLPADDHTLIEAAHDGWDTFSYLGDTPPYGGEWEEHMASPLEKLS